VDLALRRRIMVGRGAPGRRSSWVGVWWDTPPSVNDPSTRSDVISFDNVCINCNAAPGTGVLRDGMCNTFISYANILNGAYGLRVINSRHDTHYLVPSFLNAFALLIENATIDLSIETGTEFKITSSDMDMCRENSGQILPDQAGSPTVRVCFTMAGGRVEVMAPIELEMRLSDLEREVARLKAKVEGAGRPGTPWWERVAGSFADDPAHEKAMKLGRDYRASLRTGMARTRKG
jgi:hypothetical protein